MQTLEREWVVELETFTKDIEDADGNEVPTECVDMRIIFKAMYDNGAMSKIRLISMSKMNSKSTVNH